MKKYSKHFKTYHNYFIGPILTATFLIADKTIGKIDRKLTRTEHRNMSYQQLYNNIKIEETTQ